MIKELVTTVFNQLNNAELRYVVLRNYENFPYDVGNDLDILVSTQDLNEMDGLIKNAFSSLGYLSKSIPMKKNGVLYKGVKIHSDGSTTSLSIHVQFWISLELNKLQQTIPGISYKVFIDQLNERELITQDGCEFYVASPVDRFILLLRQWIFKKKPAYKKQLSDLLKNEKVNDFCKKCDSMVTAELLYESDSNSNKFLRIFALERWGNLSAVKNYSRVLESLLVRKRKKLAPIIYVTGPDGAGKTSVSSALTESFKVLDMNFKHVYSIKRNMIRHGIFIIRRKIHGTDDNKFSDDPSARKFRFIMTEDITDRDDGTALWNIRKLVTLMISISDVFINFIPVTYFRMRYGVVIVETSPYDIFIKYHMPKFEILEKVFAPAFPKASFGLLLKADAEIIAERKKELYPEEIDSYYSRIDDVLTKAKSLDSFHEVRTDIGFDETKECVYQIVATNF